MTRPHMQQFHCPNCQTWHSSETSFGRWIRNQPELDSRQGYCVTDQDYWVLKFRTEGERDFQLLMGIEIKTFGADLSDPQRDVLHIINQLMRNRRQTPTKQLQFQAGTAPLRVLSTLKGRRVNVRSYGIHLLQFSGLGPDDSEWIKWDGVAISERTLVSLLRFDLDPDTLKPLDLRKHHPQRPFELFKETEC